MKKKHLSLLVVCLVLMTILTGCSASVSTANYQDLQTASEIDQTTNKAVTATSTFTTTTPTIYVTGSINNAPEGTKIKAEWFYLENDPDVLINDVTLDLKEINTNFNFSLSKPTAGWPKGQYEVKLYIDDKYSKSVNFEVK